MRRSKSRALSTCAMEGKFGFIDRVDELRNGESAAGGWFINSTWMATSLLHSSRNIPRRLHFCSLSDSSSVAHRGNFLDQGHTLIIVHPINGGFRKQRCPYSSAPPPHPTMYLSFHAVWPTLKDRHPGGARQMIGLCVVFVWMCVSYLQGAWLQWTCCIKACASVRLFSLTRLFSPSSSSVMSSSLPHSVKPWALVKLAVFLPPPLRYRDKDPPFLQECTASLDILFSSRHQLTI